MNFNDVFNTVREVIADSCGISMDIIKLNSPLFPELGISSIDLVDILYTLEMKYDISLALADIEKVSRKELMGKPFAVDNILTDEALVIIKNKMPEIPPGKLKPGITIDNLMDLFTVESLCNTIIEKKQSKSA